MEFEIPSWGDIEAYTLEIAKKLHPKKNKDAPDDISALISLLTDIELISGMQDLHQHHLPAMSSSSSSPSSAAHRKLTWALRMVTSTAISP